MTPRARTRPRTRSQATQAKPEEHPPGDIECPRTFNPLFYLAIALVLLGLLVHFSPVLLILSGCNIFKA